MGNTPIETAPRLDWSIHAAPPLWPVSSKLFLAQAVNEAGAALWDLWDNNLPGWLAHPKLPLLPQADEAFDGDHPRPAIHAEFGPYITRLMPAAEYRALFIDEAPPVHILQWEKEQDEPICRGHWDEAVRMSFEQAGEREFAAIVIVHVARLLTELAVQGRLRTFARPLLGGDLQPIPPRLWEIDPQARIASCTLNLEHPFTPSAPPTHHIFVEAEDLERELASLPPQRKINPIRALVGATSERDRQPAIVKEIVDWLVPMMERPTDGTPWKWEHWRKPRFIEAALDHFGARFEESRFNRAYELAKLRFPHFRQRGAPRKITD
jgi:hypothetical protein